MEDRKTIKVIRLVLLGLVAAFLLFWGFAWSTFEVGGVGRYSIFFRLGAPEHLRAVELVGECRSPEYYWKGRDGEGVPFSFVIYGSSAPVADLFGYYGARFKKQSCIHEITPQALGAEQMLDMKCSNEDFRNVQVSVENKGICKEIRVGFVDEE
jgi:hypothetical protein